MIVTVNTHASYDIELIKPPAIPINITTRDSGVSPSDTTTLTP